MTERVLSVVSPVRDEELGLRAFVKEVELALAQVDLGHEIILVDDGSTDGTWELITRLSASDPRVRGLRLSRNFGKGAAIIAGLEEARGDAVVVLDADMQHPPRLLPELIGHWRRGASVVEAVKRDRAGQPLGARVGAAMFNQLFSRLTGVSLIGTCQAGLRHSGVRRSV
jgi:polyisoprenyl-phosphate glycosyltransferase